MKNLYKLKAMRSIATHSRWLCAIALAAVIGFAFAACDNDTTGGETAPSITTSSLPDGTVNTAYSQTLAATGDTPIIWSLDSGVLPTGLSLSTAGTISGTPTIAETADFTVKATNAAGSGTKALSITITTTGGETAPTITTSSLPDGTVNTAYSQTLAATGDTPITWSLDSGVFPTGLSLSTAGTISGMPTIAETANFTVKATNAAGSGTKALSITITATGGETADGSSMGNAIPLTENVWADGNLLEEDSELWYKFTATTSATNGQRIHFASVDTSVMIYAQLYDESGSTVGSQSSLHNLTSNISRTVTSGETYYIKVTLYSSTYVNRPFKLAFNNSTTPPPSVQIPTVGVIQLTENVWTEGNLLEEDSELWYKFTATTSATNGQRIHFISVDASVMIYAQLYDESGSTVGSQSSLSDYTTNISRTVTSGETYYIKVTLYLSSTYVNRPFKLAFNNSTTPPPSVQIPTVGVIQLTENVWTEGSISTADGEQWYSFTATASSQRIHFTPGPSSVIIEVQLYDNNGSAIGSSSSFSSNNNISRTVTNNETYYIKVTLYSSIYADRTFKLTFNNSTTPPPSVQIPTVGVIQLTENVWANGSLPNADSEQWFKFTATANSQRLYFNPGTSRSVYAQLYNEQGSAIGSNLLFFDSGYNSMTVTNGDTYYIKATLSFSSYIGNFQLSFNASTVAPQLP